MSSQYMARQPDAQGFIDYPESEHQVWHGLISRQLQPVEGRACQEYLDGIEFGLVHTLQGRRIYGGGILSSAKETRYCLSSVPEHQPFAPLQAMRTPYRMDILQPLHFVLPELKRLFELAHEDLLGLIPMAMQLGLHAPKFAAKVSLGSPTPLE
jgi:phenylalanine-4-hydroxylase